MGADFLGVSVLSIPLVRQWTLVMRQSSVAFFTHILRGASDPMVDSTRPLSLKALLVSVSPEKY